MTPEIIMTVVWAFAMGDLGMTQYDEPDDFQHSVWHEQGKCGVLMKTVVCRKMPELTEKQRIEMGRNNPPRRPPSVYDYLFEPRYVPSDQPTAERVNGWYLKLQL